MKPETEERLARSFELLAENQPIPEIGYAHPKFQAELRDKGYFREFATKVYQNGKEAPATCLSLPLVAKVNALKDGVFLGGQVRVTHQGGALHLTYKFATADDRMQTLTLFKTFDELIDKLTAEQQPAAQPA